eukprot:TRINITY_DN86_c0_g1_i2.p1 TRINITY_DN86_c0_g1~~TRINITY_DN86_c0_g1_i2.p1  ORF type:complete len:377 (+),score=151.54 TRINITY_DN86_c0_g1_i2:68-1132(+)
MARAGPVTRDCSDTAERREALDESLPGNEPWRAVVYGFEDEGAAVMMDFTSAPSDYVRPEQQKEFVTGSFSDRIELLQCKATDQQFVAKVIGNAEGKKRECMMRERTTLRALADVPNIVRLRHSMETQEELFLVLEKFDSDMFDFVRQRKKLSEADARQVALQLLTAVDGMHSKGIAHRDIKVENLLVRETAAGFLQVAVSDFGSAHKFDLDNPRDSGLSVSGMWTAPELMPPIIARRQSSRIGFRQVTAPDLWGIGMVLHLLLTGSLPLPRHCLKKPRTLAEWDSLHRAVTAPYGFSSARLRTLSPAAQDLVRGLLQPWPQARLTAAEALKHEWLAGVTAPDSPLTAVGPSFC